MAEINYKNSNDYIAQIDIEQLASVYLIYGEEYLYKSVFQALLDKIIPKEKRNFGYEPADDENESISEIIEKLNTFSLMSGKKVVSLCDSKIFYSKRDDAAILTKAKSAFDNEDNTKASRYLISLLSVAGLDFEGVLTDKGKKAIKFHENFGNDDGWLKDIVSFCMAGQVTIPESADSAKVLSAAIENGFPDDHHLIITADIIDKRKSLFNTIKSHGVIIDCSVPKGDRKADKDQQHAVLRENTNIILAKSGKQIDPAAYQYLYEMTGFDLRTFTDNLEKLVGYTGQNKRITLNDAKSLLRRTKQDPIYELSGAVAERNLEKSLFFTGTLLKNSIYPLQILATIVNQVRRLLVAKDFLTGLPQGKWRNGIDYNSFRTNIMPLIKERDALIINDIEVRENRFIVDDTSEKKGRKKKITSDIILAKNPNSPYPVYLLMKNSGRYSLDELVMSLDFLKNADRRLKSTGEDARLILDDLLIKVCSPNRG